METMRIGGVGCISATGNSNPKRIVQLYENVNTPEAKPLQRSVSDIRATFQSRPMIPALKAIVSRAYEDPQWEQVRPPLVKLPNDEADFLVLELEGHSFSPRRIFS